jgi:hypothetical protein
MYSFILRIVYIVHPFTEATGVKNLDTIDSQDWSSPLISNANAAQLILVKLWKVTRRSQMYISN